MVVYKNDELCSRLKSARFGKVAMIHSVGKLPHGITPTGNVVAGLHENVTVFFAEVNVPAESAHLFSTVHGNATFGGVKFLQVNNIETKKAGHTYVTVCPFTFTGDVLPVNRKPMYVESTAVMAATPPCDDKETLIRKALNEGILTVEQANRLLDTLNREISRDMIE